MDMVKTRLLSMDITFTQCKQLAKSRNLRVAIWDLKDQPEWTRLNGDLLDLCAIQAIQDGGCASGAHMDAVTYYKASQTMAEYGDEVLDYINDMCGELPQPENDISWTGLAVFYLSYAIELWCLQFDLEGVEI